jgi:aspartyl-tRNA synthetase
MEDASRSEKDLEANPQLARVAQDTRLNFRTLDLRTPANNAIFRLQSSVCRLFRDTLHAQGFTEIHTPKMIAGTSEGGSAVFRFEYMSLGTGCLAQSPQLYKQMAICGDLERVFEIGPVFRAENSHTHRHLCEFTGLDMEMTIKEHYFEVLDVLDKLFVAMFNGLSQGDAALVATVNQQYPAEPFKFCTPSLRLTFAEGIKMLQDAGVEVDPLGDLSTATERVLGKLVKVRSHSQPKYYPKSHLKKRLNCVLRISSNCFRLAFIYDINVDTQSFRASSFTHACINSKRFVPHMDRGISSPTDSVFRLVTCTRSCKMFVPYVDRHTIESY